MLCSRPRTLAPFAASSALAWSLALIAGCAADTRGEEEVASDEAASTEACILGDTCPEEALVVMPQQIRQSASQSPVDARYAFEFSNGARAVARSRVTTTSRAMRIPDGLEVVLASPVHYNLTRAPWVSRALLVEILAADSDTILKRVALADDQVKNLRFDAAGAADKGNGERVTRWGTTSPQAKESHKIALGALVPKGASFRLRLTVLSHTISGWTPTPMATESHEIRLVMPGLSTKYTFDDKGQGTPFSSTVRLRSASLDKPRSVAIQAPLAGRYAIDVRLDRKASPTSLPDAHRVAARVGDKCYPLPPSTADGSLRFVATLPKGASTVTFVHTNPIWDVPGGRALSLSTDFVEARRTEDGESPTDAAACAVAPAFTDPFDAAACEGKTLGFRDQMRRHGGGTNKDGYLVYPGVIGDFHVAHRTRSCSQDGLGRTCGEWTRLFDFPNGASEGDDAIGIISSREDYIEREAEYAPNFYAPLSLDLTSGSYLKVLCTDGNKDKYAPGHWQSGGVLGPWGPFCAAWHSVDVKPAPDASPNRFHRGDLYGNTRWGLSHLRYDAMTETCMRLTLSRTIFEGKGQDGVARATEHEAVILGRFEPR